MELVPATVSASDLPANVTRREDLSDDSGWWGYSMRDVPERKNGPAYVAMLSGITVAAYRDGPRRNYTVGMIDRTGRGVSSPQVRFRPGHAQVLRSNPPRKRMGRATWIVERVYDNHSHWLTAHLPKLLLAKEHGVDADLVLPTERTSTMDRTLAAIGIDPDRLPGFDPATVLEVEQMALIVSDRFHPDLLNRVRTAFGASDGPARRRIFISRARARGRHLLNEETLWSALEAHGFERTMMEALDFDAQVQLMRETRVLVGPHGAGLTNMIFMPPGGDVVEIADTSYPNPNFYAMAAALGHRYWLIPAGTAGEGHALDRDLTVEEDRVIDAVGRMS